jgi:hypothetical protein
VELFNAPESTLPSPWPTTAVWARSGPTPVVKDSDSPEMDDVGQLAFSLAPFALVAIGLAAIRPVEPTRAQADATTMSVWLSLL